MCFYDQEKFSCGDYRWGHFRVHCSKEHRIGETCGMKLVMSTLPIEGNCRLCDKFETKRRRCARELDRIKRCTKVPGMSSASIERLEETVRQLECEMKVLINKRGMKLQSTKTPNDELAAPSERRNSYVREWLNGSTPQDYSRASDGQLMLSAVDDGISISSGFSGNPTESTAMTTQPGSEVWQTDLSPSSSQARSCTSESGSEQPIQPDDLTSAQPKSPMSSMKDENTNPLNPNHTSQQLYGVPAISPFMEGQKAVSRTSPWTNLSSMAATAVEHVTSRVFDTLDIRSIRNWMITVGLPILRLCEPPLEEGMSRVRWKCVSRPASSSSLSQYSYCSADCTNSAAVVNFTTTTSRSGLALPRS
jgi:hypothetical protein